MGCTQAKGITVEQITKSPRGSLQRRNSLLDSVSGGKPTKSSPSKVKSKASISLDNKGGRMSQSTQLSMSQINEDNPEMVKSKPKIKSVRKLPPPMERSKLQDIEELKSSGRYDKDTHMERSQLHRLIRVYDLG